MPHTIHTHSETKHQPGRVTSKVNSCGCDSQQETCCQLDCLTQPNFFGGQLLSDTDLTQLLIWSKDKFRLSRFRHGWGVVCGLDVQCDSGSQAVRVGQGYAIDCCGHDILVCEDTTIPLDDACASPADPCDVPGKVTRGHGAEEGKTINFFGCPIPKSELREKILTLRYVEVASNFETALGYATPDGTANCQPSRTHESFTPVWVDPYDQRVAAHESLKNEYEACREVVQKYWAWHEGRKSDWSNEKPRKRWEDIRAWLLKWIDGTGGVDAHPLHQFCWLRDCLCTMDEINFESLDQYISNILFWLVQDCRNHTLQSTCRDCPDNHGVPLARVYLRVPKREKCKVLAIDPYPPYRRPLSLDSWPAPSGLVNIGQAIWRSPEQARALLMEMGLAVVSQDTPFQIVPQPDALYKNLECGLYVKRDERISLQVLDTQGHLGQRVVGVCSAPLPSDGKNGVEEALARVVAAAATARARSEELAKQLRDRATDPEEASLAMAAVTAGRDVNQLAQQLLKRGTLAKEEDAKAIATAAIAASHAVEALANKLREHGTNAREEETLALALAAANTARARSEELAQRLRERGTATAKPAS